MNELQTILVHIILEEVDQRHFLSKCWPTVPVARRPFNQQWVNVLCVLETKHFNSIQFTLFSVLNTIIKTV